MEDLYRLVQELKVDVEKTVNENVHLKETKNPSASDLARQEAMMTLQKFQELEHLINKVAVKYPYLETFANPAVSEEERKQAFEELEKLKVAEQNKENLAAQFK